MYSILSLAQEDQLVEYTNIMWMVFPEAWKTGIIHEFYDDDLPFSDLDLIAKYVNYTGGISSEVFNND